MPPGHDRPYFYFGYEVGKPMLNVKETQRELRREDVNPELSILAQRKDPDQYPEITYLGERFREILLYREWSFGPRAVTRAPQRTDPPSEMLAESLDNLGLVLSRLRREPRLKRNLIEKVRAVYQGIEDMEAIVQGGTVQVFIQEGSWSVPATRLCDGTLRYLCLLAILLNPSPPPLICIEEPELGLHPDILPGLADLLVETAERTQVVVTTHSEILVDALNSWPETVFVCEKGEQGTSLRRLHASELQVWLKEYSLGQLWRSGELGGNRW